MRRRGSRRLRSEERIVERERTRKKGKLTGNRKGSEAGEGESGVGGDGHGHGFSNWMPTNVSITIR